jgi:hypothetical protein
MTTIRTSTLHHSLPAKASKYLLTTLLQSFSAAILSHSSPETAGRFLMAAPASFLREVSINHKWLDDVHAGSQVGHSRPSPAFQLRLVALLSRRNGLPGNARFLTEQTEPLIASLCPDRGHVGLRRKFSAV